MDDGFASFYIGIVIGIVTVVCLLGTFTVPRKPGIYVRGNTKYEVRIIEKKAFVPVAKEARP